ncbi:MAG: hypothetical protein ABSA32_15230 [Candidatus Acidiferrales bacterium]
MLKTFQYWLLCGLGAIAIVLVGANIWLYVRNRSVEAEVNARAQYIQQTAPINDLHQQMARALAELAIKNNDEQLLMLLSDQGITINRTSTVPANSAPAPAQKGKP